MASRRWIAVGTVVVIGGLVLGLGDSAKRAITGHFRKTAMNADLLDAVKTRDVPWAASLLARGADIEVKNHEDYDSPSEREDDLTPLALAIHKDDVPMVRMLLEHGANIQARTKGDWFFPPRDIILSTAAAIGDVSIATLLLDRGAQVDVRSGMNETPLMIAASNKRPQVVALLIRRGANVNAVDDRGFTPLHMVSGVPNRASKQSLQNREAVILLLKNAGAHL